MIIQESKRKTFDLIYATSVVVTLSTFFFFEGGATNSFVKIGVMALAPLVFLLRYGIVSHATLLGLSYWLWCYFSSLLNGDQRFSTIGFLGMYIITFIVYYNLLHDGVFSFQYFKRLLRILLMTFGIVLVIQQMCLLVGIRTMPIVNLNNQVYLSLTKLPSLTMEPSHTARLLAVMALCYWRMYEMERGEKPTIRLIFQGEMKYPMLLFIWSMLTMGSGTAFIAIGILSFYFITKKTFIYIIPLFVLMYFLAGTMGLSQFERANRLVKASTTGEINEIQDADGSGASRIIPLVNTLTKTDLTKKETWVGKGSVKIDKLWWTKTDYKISVIDQYGMIGFIITMFLVYRCIIGRFFSIETLLFLGLLGMSVGNVYYLWGCFMLFAGVRYFQIMNGNGLLIETIESDG